MEVLTFPITGRGWQRNHGVREAVFMLQSDRLSFQSQSILFFLLTPIRCFGRFEIIWERSSFLTATVKHSDVRMLLHDVEDSLSRHTLALLLWQAGALFLDGHQFA